jgi:mono/diheme cytochrome c family protein
MKKTILLALTLLSAAVVARAADAEATWHAHCAMCHGKDGKGETPAGKKLGSPDLTSPKVQASFTDEAAFKAIKDGVVKDGHRKMKAFGSDLSDKDIKELVKYVRTFKKDK